MKTRWTVLIGDIGFLFFCAQLVIFFAVVFFQAVIGIEMRTLRFKTDRLRVKVEEQQMMQSKLEVERDLLTLPQTLKKNAEKMGMSQAQPGRIRKMYFPERSSVKK